MKKFIIISLALVIVSEVAHSQGCILVRNISGLGQYDLTSNSFSTSSWQINVSSRYFKAYRDYKGKIDLKTPAPDKNIIKSYSMDLGVTKLLPNGWSIDFNFPISANSRTTDLEHGGPNTPRHTTSALRHGRSASSGP